MYMFCLVTYLYVHKNHTTPAHKTHEIVKLLMQEIYDFLTCPYAIKQSCSESHGTSGINVG